MGLIDSMMKKRRRKARKRLDRRFIRQDVSKDSPDVKFSYWTRWHKLALAGLAAVILGSGSVGAYHCSSEVLRRGDYEMRVRSHTFSYRSAPQHTIPATQCLRPGSTAHVFRSAMLNRDNSYNARTMVLTDRLRNRMSDMGEDDPMLCIRPVDGGQDVSVQSHIQIRGLDYALVRDGQRAGIRFMHGVPGIFSPESEIDSVSINGMEIPLSYLTQNNPDNIRREGYHYLDIDRLVDDNIIEETDFDDMHIRIAWSVGFDRISSFESTAVGPMSAYEEMPKHIRQYIRPAPEFPSQHSSIRDVVDAFEGDEDDVMAVIRYAMESVDDTLEYYRPGHHDSPVPDLFTEERGNCLDYARLYVTILRGFGVPARLADANVLQTGGGTALDGLHAWAEVYLPMLDGDDRWIIVEPTWADNAIGPHTYINYVTNRYIYNMDIRAELDTGHALGHYEIFQTHDLVSVPRVYSTVGEDGADDAENIEDANPDSVCGDCVTYMHQFPLPG